MIFPNNFKSSSYPSFVYQLALNHLSLFRKSSYCPLVPFYFPEYCKSNACNNNLSIWHAIFDSFNALHTNSGPGFPKLPLRSDASMNTVYRAMLGERIGCGEVKAHHQALNHRLISIDLLRVTTLAKDASDKHSLKSISRSKILYTFLFCIL